MNDKREPSVANLVGLWIGILGVAVVLAIVLGLAVRMFLWVSGIGGIL